MSERNGARFEGMVLAKLDALDERTEETLQHVRAIQQQCAAAQVAHAALATEVDGVREKANLNARVIWSAVAWVIAAALGTVLALLGVK